jgi:hypothetical protein
MKTKRKNSSSSRKTKRREDSGCVIPPPPVKHILKSYTLLNPSNAREIGAYVPACEGPEKQACRAAEGGTKMKMGDTEQIRS